MLIKVKERGFCILWSRTKNITAVSKVTPQGSPILALPMMGGAWGGLEQPFSTISDSRSTPAHRALASSAGHPVASPGVHQAHVESHLPEDIAARVPKWFQQKRKHLGHSVGYLSTCYSITSPTHVADFHPALALSHGGTTSWWGWILRVTYLPSFVTVS